MVGSLEWLVFFVPLPPRAESSADRTRQWKFFQKKGTDCLANPLLSLPPRNSQSKLASFLQVVVNSRRLPQTGELGALGLPRMTRLRAVKGVAQPLTFFPANPTLLDNRCPGQPVC